MKTLAIIWGVAITVAVVGLVYINYSINCIGIAAENDITPAKIIQLEKNAPVADDTVYQSTIDVYDLQPATVTLQ